MKKRTGSFVVGRQLFDHELMREKPFPRAVAWLWLISEAAWRPREVRLRGRKITLKRGQLAHSIRFMADAWGWTPAKVQRFIGYLQRESMADSEVVRATDTVGRILTLCNYEKYQFPNGYGDTDAGYIPRQEQGKSKKRIISRNSKEEARGFYASFGSVELEAWESYSRRIGGSGYPRDRAGGWFFPSRWPPSNVVAIA